ncbi:hypothetical protein GUITHDRAFT_134104 [Guillardia theta CCMP2712]|uniref:Uncharacterized protein n=1 Tax=Guillardia theta (strain CCMP2712) TaxID=905079 RepID=L1JUH1_GUITC|nr:hypothetical protein GUITHDRAFT_134104 [Guillardia theta CCMP2712]EKX51738.1 hypothetical protein GUITHDRAFT_134104 [Guillardia theta CCMP2712]|eukprot:XP_005838718.1 hypothetical protein GUITHDRAFT_134104 [Guillardia theta CCMP2712]
MSSARKQLCVAFLLMLIRHIYNEQQRLDTISQRNIFHRKQCRPSLGKLISRPLRTQGSSSKEETRLRGGGEDISLSDIQGDISVPEKSPTPREPSPPYYPPPDHSNISNLFNLPPGTIFTRDVRPEDPNLTYWRSPIEKDLGWAGPVWGEDCPEATMDPPPGHIRTWGDCENNETFVGCYDDGTPALYGEVEHHFRHEMNKSCDELSDSMDHLPELMYLYRQRPNYTGMTEFDPKVHEGYNGWIGRGSTPKEEMEDEYSDGGWGVNHYEVGRSIQYVNVPMQHQDFMRVGKEARERDDEMSGGGSDKGSEGSDDLDRDDGNETSSSAEIDARQLNVHNHTRVRTWQEVLQAHRKQYMNVTWTPDYCEIPAQRAEDEPTDVIMSTKMVNGSRIRREEDICRLFLEGEPVDAGFTGWTFEEVKRENLLRLQKWRKWRKWLEEERERRKPLWSRNLTEWQDFNMTFVDLNGNKFPASKGRTPSEVHANTVSAYLKNALDQAAHAHRQLYKEREESLKSIEDPTVSPWIYKNGYRFRLRQIIGGICLQPEVQVPGSSWVFGSKEAQGAVDAWIAANEVKGPEDCWNCMEHEASQDEEFYCKTLEQTPDNASALCDYGLLLYRQGREAEAEDAFAQAVKCPMKTAAGANFPPHVTAYHNLAVIKAYDGKMDEAEDLLQRSLALYPENDRVMVKLGEIMEDEHKDFEEAERLYSRAFVLNPYGKEMLYAYGRFVFTVRRDFNSAKMLIEMSVKVDPFCALKQFVYAVFLLAVMGRRDQAKDGLEWTVNDDLGKKMADASVLYAVLLLNRELEPELRDTPDYDYIKSKKRERVRIEQKIFLPEGDESSELERTLDAADLSSYTPAYSQLEYLKIFAVCRDLEQARELFQHALELEPNRVDAALGLSWAVREESKGGREEVRNKLEELLGLFPNNTRLLRACAEWDWHEKGNLSSAHDLYLRAMKVADERMTMETEGGSRKEEKEQRKKEEEEKEEERFLLLKNTFFTNDTIIDKLPPLKREALIPFSQHKFSWKSLWSAEGFLDDASYARVWLDFGYFLLYSGHREEEGEERSILNAEMASKLARRLLSHRPKDERAAVLLALAEARLKSLEDGIAHLKSWLEYKTVMTSALPSLARKGLVKRGQKATLTSSYALGKPWAHDAIAVLGDGMMKSNSSQSRVAESMLRAVLRLNPYHLSTLLVLGDHHSRTERKEEAFKFFKRAFRMSPFLMGEACVQEFAAIASSPDGTHLPLPAGVSRQQLDQLAANMTGRAPWPFLMARRERESVLKRIGNSLSLAMKSRSEDEEVVRQSTNKKRQYSASSPSLFKKIRTIGTSASSSLLKYFSWRNLSSSSSSSSSYFKDLAASFSLRGVRGGEELALRGRAPARGDARKGDNEDPSQLGFFSSFLSCPGGKRRRWKKLEKKHEELKEQLEELRRLRRRLEDMQQASCSLDKTMNEELEFDLDQQREFDQLRVAKRKTRSEIERMEKVLERYGDEQTISRVLEETGSFLKRVKRSESSSGRLEQGNSTEPMLVNVKADVMANMSHDSLEVAAPDRNLTRQLLCSRAALLHLRGRSRHARRLLGSCRKLAEDELCRSEQPAVEHVFLSSLCCSPLLKKPSVQQSLTLLDRAEQLLPHNPLLLLARYRYQLARVRHAVEDDDQGGRGGKLSQLELRRLADSLQQLVSSNHSSCALFLLAEVQELLGDYVSASSSYNLSIASYRSSADPFMHCFGGFFLLSPSVSLLRMALIDACILKGDRFLPLLQQVMKMAPCLLDQEEEEEEEKQTTEKRQHPEEDREEQESLNPAAYYDGRLHGAARAARQVLLCCNTTLSSSLEATERALLLSPADNLLLLHRARLLAELFQHEGCSIESVIRGFRLLLALYPYNEQAMRGLADALQTAEDDELLEHIDESSRRSEHKTYWQLRRIEYAIRLGDEEEVEEEEFFAAVKELEEIGRQDPSNGHVRFLQGMAEDEETEGGRTRALDLYQQAIVLDPQHRMAMRASAELLEEEERLEEARSMYERSLLLLPNDLQDLLSCGRVCEGVEDEAAAGRMYVRALQFQPRNAQALNSWGVFLWKRRKDLASASCVFQEAVQLHPADGVLLSNLAAVKEEGEEEENLLAADRLLLNALQANSDEPDILVRLGKLRWRRRRLEEARSFLDAALSMDPAHEEARILAMQLEDKMRADGNGKEEGAVKDGRRRREEEEEEGPQQGQEKEEGQLKIHIS